MIAKGKKLVNSGPPLSPGPRCAPCSPGTRNLGSNGPRRRCSRRPPSASAPDGRSRPGSRRRRPICAVRRIPGTSGGSSPFEKGSLGACGSAGGRSVRLRRSPAGGRDGWKPSPTMGHGGIACVNTRSPAKFGYCRIKLPFDVRGAWRAEKSLPGPAGS